MPISQEEIFKQHNKAEEILIISYIAINTSAIAYGLSKIEGRILQWSLLPLFLAVLCWSLSLLFCLNYLQLVSDFFYTNNKVYEAFEGRDKISRNDPEAIQKRTSEIHKELDKEDIIILTAKRGRHILLMLGVLFFII
ncbi:MAG: hypothetical protein JWQ09_1824 [Segetibacter sp.]|nr:hypothetical protein [Segetibacter sp.]